MAERTPVFDGSSLFEDHASQVITRLRSTIAAVVESVPDKRGRATDLAEAFSIDTKLAWRIGRVIGDTDPFSAARYIPGASGFKIFLRAAKRRDVSKGVIAAAEAAFGSFSELVHTHAGNRKAFDMLLAGHTLDDRDKADLEHRKQMFEGGGYLWGVQAGVGMRVDLLAPSADPAMYDCATIRGFVDLRRIRPNVPWRISRAYTADADGGIHTSLEREPLENSPGGGANSSELPLMPTFCSRPLPECRRVEGPSAIEYELVEGAVGNTGILTCVMGEIIRRAEPRYRTAQYPDISPMFRLRTPCELVVFDLMLHRDLFGRRIKPELILYGDLFAKQIGPQYRDCDRLPISEKIEYLGIGPGVAAISEIARYPDLIQCALDRSGWDGADFDVYRVRLRYPPIPSNVVIRHDLPEPPDA